jgi:hypothetical protein
MPFPVSYSRDVDSGTIPGEHKSAMKIPQIARLSACFGITALCALTFSPRAVAQPCPTVKTTTQTAATMRAIVKSVNCLVESGASPATTVGSVRTADVRTSDARTADTRIADARPGTQVDTLPIIGPQHSRIYPGFLLAILSMPVDNSHKSALVTPDAPQATVRGAGGGECKLKLNSDRTLDAQCNQAGGTVFVVFR